MGKPHMTDDELERYLELFRKYRKFGKLSPAERKEFKVLAAKWNKQSRAENSR